MKKLLSVIICLAMLFSRFAAFPTTASAYTITGTCGDNLTWTFDIETGVLTISGEGAMYDYSFETSYDEEYDEYIGIRAPWADYSDYIESVTITPGVTTIGDYAFFDCTELSAVTIPDSVIGIGLQAFSYCRSLTSITLPGSVRSIGSEAFCDCTSLTSITIPGSVRTIGDNSFSYCYSLATVSIGNGVTRIDGGAFVYCTSLTSINIPESVTTIGSGVFSCCGGLESITVDPGNPVYHSDGNCLIKTSTNELISGCKNSIIPSDGSVTSIGNSAFSGRTSLTSITIPNSVTSIGHWAFSDCNSLNDTYYIGTAEEWNNINISSNNEPLLRNIHYCIDSGICGNNLKWVLYDNGVLTISGTGDMYDYDCQYINGYYITTAPWGNYSDYIQTVSISYGLTSVGEYAFSSCTSLTSISIPGSVTEIGLCAFFDCHSLESIIVEEGNSVYHSNGNCLIETKTKTLIVGCNYSIIPSDGSVASIGDNAFYDCSSLTTISIPDGVTYIGQNAFTCTSLTSVTIPGSVRYIDDLAFDGCRNLTSVEFSEGLEGIGMSAFCCCTSLTTLTLPGSLINAYMAFEGCSSLTTVTFLDGAEKIDAGMFCDCTSLTSVIIPNSVTDIWEGAFSGCNALSDIYYFGTETEWNNIDIIDDNDPLFNATIHFNATDCDIYGHDYEVTGSVPATCVSDGHITYLCSRCGDTYSETIPAAHTPTGERVTFTPTCTAPGGYYMLCSVCGEICESGLVPPLGHTPNRVEEPATCTEDGSYYIECTVCGEFLDSGTIPATGHAIVTDEAVAATCTEDGLTEGSHCSVCGEVFTAQQVIPAMGHTPAVTVDVPPTCTGTGYQEICCSVCGAVLEENVLPATGHTPTGERVYFAPTCTEIGGYYMLCSVCGEICESGMQPPLGHLYPDEYTITLQPTETTPGVKTRTCERCGEVEETSLLYCPGDANGDGKVNTQDLRLMKKSISGVASVDQFVMVNSDFNGDGKVNVQDLKVIKKMIAGVQS